VLFKLQNSLFIDYQMINLFLLTKKLSFFILENMQFFA